MATTSNFGWTTPDDTDLVKDGALAIRTLGNNIDTSLVDLKGGTTGQILSKNSNSDLDYTWINNDQGDITEVQAGTGISVASGTGPVPVITNTVATEFDAKGDLVVGTGADTFDKLTAGNNNDVLTVDSSTATGLKWAAPAASSPLTTKGDLYTYSTTNARLGVGANGETLVADSSTTTGLRWQGDWNTGKNKIINGDFQINQRNFTSVTANATFTFDRWFTITGGGSQTYTPQTFTPGTAPVAGYEGTNLLQCATTAGGSMYAGIGQKIEDVRTFANQAVVVSFWAKANSGTPKIRVQFDQEFGSGGSSAVVVTAQYPVISTSWTRYTLNFSIPSISGKTVGTSSALTLSLLFNNAFDANLGQQTNTFQIWGVQVEAGSVATPFTTATGTLAGERSACMRYYQRFNSDQLYAIYASGPARSTTQADFLVPFLVPLRTSPSSTIDYANLAMNGYDGDTVRTVTALVENSINKSPFAAVVTATHTGTNFTQGNIYRLFNDNNASGYLGFSAEL